jgi:hypothetical protein
VFGWPREACADYLVLLGPAMEPAELSFAPIVSAEPVAAAAEDTPRPMLNPTAAPASAPVIEVELAGTVVRVWHGRGVADGGAA